MSTLNLAAPLDKMTVHEFLAYQRNKSSCPLILVSIKGALEAQLFQYSHVALSYLWGEDSEGNGMKILVSAIESIQWAPKDSYHFSFASYVECGKRLYCTYEEIDQAVSHWGKIEAILADEEDLHMFFVQFNRPIEILQKKERRKQKVIRIDQRSLGFYQVEKKIAPFFAVKIYSKPSRFLLSQNKVAFLLNTFLENKESSWEDVWETRVISKDPRFQKIEDKISVIGNCNQREEIKKEINELFSNQDKKNLLLKFIKDAGLKMLSEKMLAPPEWEAREFSLEEVFADYQKGGDFFRVTAGNNIDAEKAVKRFGKSWRPIYYQKPGVIFEKAYPRALSVEEQHIRGTKVFSRS